MSAGVAGPGRVAGRPLAGLVAALVTGLLVLLGLVAGAGPVSAHAELESSSPPDGATMANAPVEVSFTFGEDLLTKGNAVVITNLDTGVKVASAKPEVDGDTITVAWPQAATHGRFRVAYRVTSEDGHPVKGRIRFTVLGLPEVTLSPSPAAQSPAPILAPAPADTEDSGVLLWTLAIGVVVLGAVGVTIWSMRRGR